MPARRKDEEPIVYLAKTHPDYGWEESRYVAAQILRHRGILPRDRMRRLQREKPEPLTSVYRQMEMDFIRQYIDTIQRGWVSWEDVPPLVSKLSEPPALRYVKITNPEETRREAEQAVISAVKIWGMDGVRLPALDEEQIQEEEGVDERLVMLNQLGQEVCEMLRHWRHIVETSTIPKRKIGREILARTGSYSRPATLADVRHYSGLLAEVGKALVPKTRGKRERRATGTPEEIARYYYQELFLWRQIPGFLRAWPGARQTKVQAACEAYQITPDTKDRELFFGVREDGEKISRPLAPKEIAKLRTARRFGVSRHRVENILSE